MTHKCIRTLFVFFFYSDSCTYENSRTKSKAGAGGDSDSCTYENSRTKSKAGAGGGGGGGENSTR